MSSRLAPEAVGFVVTPIRGRVGRRRGVEPFVVSSQDSIPDLESEINSVIARSIRNGPGYTIVQDESDGTYSAESFYPNGTVSGKYFISRIKEK